MTRPPTPARPWGTRAGHRCSGGHVTVDDAHTAAYSVALGDTTHIPGGEGCAGMEVFAWRGWSGCDWFEVPV